MRHGIFSWNITFISNNLFRLFYILLTLKTVSETWTLLTLKPRIRNDILCSRYLAGSCPLHALFFWFSFLFPSLLIYLLTDPVLLYTNLLPYTTKRLTLWEMKWRYGLRRRMSEMVMDTDGTKMREKRAKVAGTCVIADRKFQLSGISGDWSVT